MTDAQSFENIEMWMKEVKEYVKWDQTKKLVLLNKTDLPEEEWAITTDYTVDFQTQTGIEVLRCSAKLGTNISEAFGKLSE